MAVKKINQPRKPKGRRPLDVPVDIIKKIDRSTSSRDESVRRLQELYDLPKEIAERLLDESQGP